MTDVQSLVMRALANGIKCRRENRKLTAQRTRARALNLPANADLESWVDTLISHNNKCAYCSNDYQHIDHIVPLSKGGGTTNDNLQPLCQSCNLTKGAK